MVQDEVLAFSWLFEAGIDSWALQPCAVPACSVPVETASADFGGFSSVASRP